MTTTTQNSPVHNDGSVSLDLGSGLQPKNPFKADAVMGVDIRESQDGTIVSADLAIEPIPFESNSFDFVTAFDFIEHIPRIIYAPGRRSCFVELMNEIYRALKPGGLFYSYTPAFPAPAAWRDPTHVNIITDETFPMYFDDKKRWANVYGFNGYFHIEKQTRDTNGIHLETIMRKLIPVERDESHQGD